MSNDLGLGKIITGDAGRDAVHIAVAPVVSDQTVYPGQRIGFIEGGNGKVARLQPELTIGIVDPFLTGCVLPGNRFWMYLYPGTITSLRHEWTHPAFDAPRAIQPISEIQAESKDWIQGFAKRVGLSYDDLIQAAKEWIELGEYINRGSLLSGERVPEEFWDHYEIVTGEVVPEEKQGSFFSFSCDG